MSGLTTQLLRRLPARQLVVPCRHQSFEYVESLDKPAPRMRFVKDADLSAESKALREKEQGDWKSLTKEEKLALYRLSFNRSFAELNAPTGEWKYVLGGTLVGVALSFFVFGLQKLYMTPQKPRTMTKEWQEAQLRYEIAIRNGPITGTASKWDYEKNEWKK